MKFDMEKSVTRAEALLLMKAHWQFAPGQETVSLEESLGRVTVENVYSVNTLPVFRASCFDGVAVRSADFAEGLPDTSTWVRGRDFERADTGDDFPDEFDAVIAIEDVILDENGRLSFVEGFAFDPKDETVDPAGTIVKGGALLVPAHARITPELMASLAMGGIAEIRVLRRIKIAFIPTGNELIAPGTKPQRGQNVETNGLMLQAMLSQRGAEVIRCPIVRDNKTELERALDEALKWADLVLINGGSSRGEEDYNSHLLERRGSFFRHGVKAAPGRPVGFAMVEGKPVLNIPGPVIAAALAEHWCISALVNHWYGLPDPAYPKVTAALTQPFKKRPGMEIIGRVSLRRTGKGYEATPITWGEDGIPGMLLHTDGFLNASAETTFLDAGETVEIELMRSPELIKKKNFFLTGNIQVGKSTILRKWIATRPEWKVGGFRTIGGARNADGSDTVHIVPATRDVELTDENRVMMRGAGFPHKTVCGFREVFDSAGGALLRESADCDVILMDEVGVQENDAQGFFDEVMRCLDSDIPVIGVCQNRQGVLTDAVRGRQDVELIWVSVENREDVLEDLMRRTL